MWNLSFIQLHEKQKEEKRKVPPEENSSTSPFLKVPLWNPKVLNPAHTITVWFNAIWYYMIV